MDNSGERNEPLYCAICLEIILEGKKKQLACRHLFHQKCLKPWVKEHANCPLCRGVVTPHRKDRYLSMSWSEEEKITEIRRERGKNRSKKRNKKRMNQSKRDMESKK